MIEYFTNAAIFLGMAFVIVGLLMLYVYARVGYDFNKFKEHWKTTGDGALPGIAAAVIVPLILAAILMFANKVFASEWFQYSEVFAGVEQTRKDSPQCEINNVDNKLTSSIGIRQHIYSFHDVSILGDYQHHSCAVGVDSAGYDAIGVQVQWRFNRN